MVSRIESFETYVLRVPLRRPIADSLYYRTHWHIPVVEIRCSDGLVGTGYSGLWAGEAQLLSVITEYIEPLALGRDPSLIGEFWDEVYWSSLHWVGRAGIAHMAQGMVDTALWDLAAKRAGVPLWRLLGGRQTSLKTYNTDGGWLNFSVEELIDDTTHMVESGWNWVKVKVGGPSLREDFKRVAAVRAALPDYVELSVDVNQKWDIVTAKRALEWLADLDVAWLEEPLHPDDVPGHAALVGRTTVPIALGESVYSSEGFRAFLDSNAVDIVQVDVTRVAGVTEWLRIATSAQERGKWVVPHAGDMMQVHQHLAAGIGSKNPGMIEYLPWGLEVFDEPVKVLGSSIVLPETPGASSAISASARKAWGTHK
jgi:L-alanine-DL-glutamate epimerase-like enolase superfamily enzyme